MKLAKWAVPSFKEGIGKWVDYRKDPIGKWGDYHAVQIVVFDAVS